MQLPYDVLPIRLERLGDFANELDEGPYLPGVLRAQTVHFMASYDHYFVDGNGRTARALFYWSLLRQGCWLVMYLTVSTILRKAPSQYPRSFLDTEQDDGDLTYFFIYHLGVLRRAIDGSHDHIARTLFQTSTYVVMAPSPHPALSRDRTPCRRSVTDNSADLGGR